MQDINPIIVMAGFLLGSGVPLSIYFLWLAYEKKKNSKGDDDSLNTSFVFSGNLRQTPLLEAIQFLEMGRREGVLHIYCGRRKGYLTFLKGKVIDAFYRNYTGGDAILQMFEIDEGDFYFEPKEITQPPVIKESIIDLAIEWDIRKQERENQQ